MPRMVVTYVPVGEGFRRTASKTSATLRRLPTGEPSMRVARAVRPALVLALATTGLAAPAIAKPKPAPKPACHLVADPEGDAKRHPIAGAPVAIFDSPALDITSADVATGKKTVSVVVRVKT